LNNKIAEAFGYLYYVIHNNDELKSEIEKVLQQLVFAFCEVFTDKQHVYEPESTVRCLGDGTMISSPLENLAPFLLREELKENMFVSLFEEKK
jgi:acetolactate synthase-1/2/3 large subunit